MKGSAGGSRSAAEVDVSGCEAEEGILHTDEKQEGSLRRYGVSRVEEQRARQIYLTGDAFNRPEDHEYDGYESHDRAPDDGLNLGPGKVGGDP